ncbi:MAG: M55 family metallopeptidase [Anaerolineae bacterium]|nr:M55 family metallopeptidase [Anaerolineae bacterium]
MKILIAADMEGVTGVVHWDHVSSAHAEYARFRKLMTGDVNAAVRGAFDGGAGEVLVTDGHGSAKNILIEELDARARLNSGGTRPLSMVQGVDAGVDAAIFVGYHARAGTPNAILDHIWTGGVNNVWLNGAPVGEIGLNAAVCGHFGVPVIALSGCQGACEEAETLLGEVETAPVKWASGRMGAECLPPERAQQAIYEAAQRAVQRLAQGQAAKPFRVQTPVKLEVEFNSSDMADGASILPDAQRDGRTLTLVAPDMVTAYRLFRAAASLA